MTLETSAADPPVLVLTIARDVSSYLPHYFHALDGLDYPRQYLSFGFLEGDSFDDTRSQIEGFVERAKIRGQNASAMTLNTHFHIEGARWEPAVQNKRRSLLAMLRNKLLAETLRSEAWVLWVDADIVHFPPLTLRHLLAVRRQIVTPHCVRVPGGKSFDLNTFQRRGWWPQSERRFLVDGLIQPPEGVGRRYLHDLRGRGLVRVDSVGGTMLLVAADVHRRGLLYPTVSYKGYIETEGFAMMARDRGIKCWAMPDLEILHANH